MKTTSGIIICFALLTVGCGSSNADRTLKIYKVLKSSEVGFTQPPSRDTKMLAAFDSDEETSSLIAPPASTGITQTADGNIADLEAKLSGVQAVASPFLIKASAMKCNSLPIGIEINVENCVALTGKIEANYKISPFRAVYSGGASYFNFCTDENGKAQTSAGAKFYFTDTSSAKSQFGLASTFVLTKMMPNKSTTGTQGRTDILLDANYRMLEITFLDFYQDETQVDACSIHTLDASGNFFMNRYYGSAHPGTLSYETHQKYISADGMYSFQQDLNPRRNGKGTGQVLSNFFTASSGTSWNDFFIVLSHAWFGGFYDYAGKLQSGSPKAYSMLHTVSVGGAVVCADGRSSTLTTWTNYPSPTATSGACMNDW